MTKEQILAIDPDFQMLIDLVVRHNTSGAYESWHQVWHDVKKMNERMRICGWDAKHDELLNHQSYDSMCSILESYSTLK